MKKILGLLTSLLILNSCAESMALLGTASSSIASSAIGGGKVAHSTASSIISHGIKQQTGKSPTEHALAYVKDNNPQNKKEKCIDFLESTNSKVCAAVREDILKTRNKILKKSKIENLALKTIQKRRR